MKRPCLAILMVLCAFTQAFAWDNHTQLSYLALEGGALAAQDLAAETLDAFVLATQAKLPGLLDRLERDAKRDIPEYAPLPPALAFTGGWPAGGGATARAAFIAAIRLNPSVPLPLYVQLRAGSARPSRPDLPVTSVDIYDNRLPNGPFQSLASGQKVSALEVIASASDEPDYGMDIGLFSDNKSPVASVYGFGPQAFGNPALPYGSQAPFHMAFAHEDPLIKAAAGFTRVSLSDWRFRLYTELSRFAFAEGHAYWGWRFAGWALHYLQDMAQPYHASVIPGKRAWGILGLYIFGSQADKDAALVLLSNRHLIVEDYLYGAMAEFHGDVAASPLYAALAGKGAQALPYRQGYLYDVVSKRAFDRGRRLDGLVAAAFPAAYVSDPSYDYGATNVGSKKIYEPWTALRAASPAKAEALDAFSAAIFADIGSSTRAYVAFVGDAAAVAAPRKAPVDLRGIAYVAGLIVIIGSILLVIIGSGRRQRRRKAAV